MQRVAEDARSRRVKEAGLLKSSPNSTEARVRSMRVS